jgi:hypothetical protein
MVTSVLPLTTIDNITAQASLDVAALASQLTGLSGGVAHGAIFGNGETLTSGVYDVGEAAAIQGTLTLDAEGNSSALFVFRITGALSSVAASEILLTNGASAANVFWKVDGAVGLGANSTFVGTAVAVTAAASLAAASIMTGRLLSTAGAVSIDSSISMSIPEIPLLGAIRLGVLSTFAMFSSAGAVANTGASNIVGDIGSNDGAISGFESPTVLDGRIYTIGDPGDTPNTKELRQRRKLELAAIKRSIDSNPRATYDITQLPTTYSDNGIFDNANANGLLLGRPWTTGL